MADPLPMRLTRRKKAAPEPELTQDDQAGLLSQAGGAAMSGLHTLGSVLSYPSRLIHGTLNAASGGQGGFGKNILNPFDSTGGIEGSHHLVQAGLLPENDPTKWEWGDLGRGVADAALDPTTYIAGLGLTGKGIKAAKAGTQVGGKIAQLAKGERALLTAKLPFASAPFMEIGAGPRTAKALETIGKYSGITRAANAVKKSLPVRLARAGFDYTVQGLTHPTLQKYVPDSVKNLFKMNKGTEADVVRSARSLADQDPDALRMSLEGVSPSAVRGGYAPHPSITEGTGTFDVPHVRVDISPQKLAAALGDRLPQYQGHLDEALEAGSKIHAPILHFGPNGELTGGGLVSKNARQMARQSYKMQRRELANRLATTPESIPSLKSRILATMDQIESGAPNGALVSARDIRRAMPDVPPADLERAILEMGGEGGQLDLGHYHDFPMGIPAEQRAELFDKATMWPQHYPDPNDHRYRYLVGVAKNRGERFAPLAPELSSVPNPAHAELRQQLGQFQQNKRNFIDLEHQRLQDVAHAHHGADEGLETLAKMIDLKEPGMGVMVPKSQVNRFRRQFGNFENTGRSGPLADHPEIGNLRNATTEQLGRHLEAGVGNQSELHDIHDFAHRRASLTGDDVAAGAISRGSKVLPGKGAEDVGRKTFLKGNAEGTVGTNKILGDTEIHDAIDAAGGDWRAAVPLIEQKYGHIVERIGQTAKHRAAVASTAKRVETLTSQLTEATAKRAELEGTGQTRKIGRYIDRINDLKKQHAIAVAAHEKALITGVDRVKALAKYAAKHPELKGQKLFGNHPIADFKLGSMSSNKKVAMSPAVYQTIRQHLNEGDQSVKLGDFLKSGGFNVRTAAEKISGETFDEPGSLKKFLDSTTIDSKLVSQLQSLNPKFTAPEAVNEAKKAAGSAMAWWKGLTLAFPASRARDAIGGVVQNILHGWADPRFLAKDVNQLLSGKTVARSYAHVPEIQQWLQKSNLPWSPENQTEALRQLVAVHMPSEHNLLADIPAGQVGAGLEQLTKNVVGTQPSTFTQRFVTDPLRTLAGRGDNGATWLGTPEAGDTLLQKAQRAAAQPFTGVRGVGDRVETTFAPVKASELVSAASDAHNRVGPFMQQIHGGTAADVAAQNVNRAQIDYSPDTFTAVERGIKNNLLPFYSFNSRIIPETARQLSDFGSPTSQFVKALDRAHGGGDPSVPDYVTQGTGIPLGVRDDGSKTFATGLGLMHEPAVSMLGLLAGGNLRAAGYDTLAQLNPAIGVPLQRITGQTFHQRGTPISDLDPTTGRLISNVGESLGLRDANAGPVRYAGDRAVDAILGATPLGRLASHARTLADPRKDIASKLVDTLTGAKITDISPGKQLATLQKRAEDLARSEGAFESRMVGFPKERLAELRETNPALAERQQKLQDIITMIKRRKTASQKAKKAVEQSEKLAKLVRKPAASK